VKRRPRRTETPVTTHVAALQGLRSGSSPAVALVALISKRTRGRVNIHPGLAYKALAQLIAAGLVRRLERPDRLAALYELTARGRKHAASEGAAIGRLFAK
jgi:DNA-binding PadR family transcriptional regulator